MTYIDEVKSFDESGLDEVEKSTIRMVKVVIFWDVRWNVINKCIRNTKHSQWICKRISVSVKKFYVVLITRKAVLFTLEIWGKL